MQSCLTDPYRGDEEAALDQLERLLKASTQRRMISDVPLGMLLSGGIDSTLVTAVGQSISDQPLKTFSIGFHNEEKSEAAAAKRIAEHLGTQHTEMYLDGQDALDVLPLLPEINDEPFGDPSQIPTYLVSKLARQHVTVALTGDGGDELFFGYKRYWSGIKYWELNRRLPKMLRNSLASILNTADRLNSVESGLSTHAACLSAEHCLDIYESRLAKYIHPEWLMKDPGVSAESYADSMKGLIECESAVAMMLHDFGHYLVDDILVKVDRASMRESLELRNPFLDPAIIEFSWRLPQAMKFRNDKGKYLPRQLLNRYVPEHLTDRPKQGFAAPVKSWLQGALTDWADELLSPANLNRQGIFNTDAVDALWQQRKTNPGKGHSKLWTLLMFQVWYEAWM